MADESESCMGSPRDFGIEPREGKGRASVKSIELNEADALIVVDVQNDFCSNGALPTNGGEDIVSVANAVMDQPWKHIVITQDWHPRGHSSFASTHEGKKPFETVDMPYGAQTLWPDHCVQQTEGAEFHPDLAIPGSAWIVRKGNRHHVDSYSAFVENDGATETGLKDTLHELHVRRVFVVGLAYDVCVRYTAEDAAKCGFEVTLLEDASRAVPTPGGIEAAKASFAKLGVKEERVVLDS